MADRPTPALVVGDRGAPDPTPGGAAAPGGHLYPLLLALPLLALELSTLGGYGYFRDELYYLASTEHLDWGYVDHPPLSIAILAAIRALLGDSLAALRIVPALLGAATIVMVARLAGRMGGGRTAQAVAALAFSFCATASIFHIYSMNAWDIFFWVVAYHLLLTALDRGSSRSWLALGAVLGLGLLNKISVLWLGAGIFVGLLATPHRRALRSRGPYLAGAVAFAIFSPHIVWQIVNGWPTLEFIRNAREKLVEVDLGGFVGNQLFIMNPTLSPLWVAGLLALLLLPSLRRWRLFAWVYLTVAAILVAGGGSRPVYLLPAYPPLLIAAGLAIERLAERRRWRWAAPAAVAWCLVLGLPLAPMAVPLLPPERFVAFARGVGIMPPAQERMELAELPQFFADHFGWPELVDTVAEVYDRLAPAERARARVIAQNYGEAGAIDVLGRQRGLPAAICGHNSYWLWGPGDWDGGVALVLGGSRADHLELFEEVERAATVTSDWAIPYENDLPVWVARRFRLPLDEAWPLARRYR